MIIRKEIKKDLKRSIVLLLVITLIVTGFVKAPVKAANTLDIADTGKLIGIGCAESDYDDTVYFVFQTIKRIMLLNEDEDLLTKDPVMDAVVYLNIGEEKYQVMELTSAPAYGDLYGKVGIYSYDDGAYEVSMSPVYYDEYDQEMSDSWDISTDYCSDCGEGSVIYPYDNVKNYGFSDEIVEYWNENGLNDWKDRFAQLTSKDLHRKYTVEYKLTVDGQVEGEYKQTGASVTDYDDYNTDSYMWGKRLEYNRIEELADYHQENNYSDLKMFKGDIYVDASKLSSMNGKLVLPNDNKSALFEINSMYVNDKVLYNDGYSKNTFVSGYNLLKNGLPELVNTKDAAVEKFIELLTGFQYTDSDFETYTDYNLYYDVYCEINKSGGHILNVGDTLFKINAYNYYDDDPSYYNPINMIKAEEMSFEEAYSNRKSDEEEFFWKSIKTPAIQMSDTGITESSEFLEYVNARYKYLDFVASVADSYKRYRLMSGDEVIAEISANDVAGILYILSEYIEEQQIKDCAELSDDYVFTYTGEYSWLYEEVQANKVTAIVPIQEEIEMPGNMSSAFTYISYTIDADELAPAIDAVGLEQDAVKVFGVTKEVNLPINNTIKEDLVNSIKNEFGNDTYEAFYKYIEEEFVTFGSKLESVVENDSSQKNTEVDVYKQDLEIPLELFETDNLGTKNEISQMWYAGNFVDYIIPYKNSYETDSTILQNGKPIFIDYTCYKTDEGYWDAPLDKVFSMKYDELYVVSFANVVFAKTPAQIAEKEGVVSDGSCRVEWEVPSDNGAEILGYQIAIMPKGTEPSESDYILDEQGCGYYEDLGDNYRIKYTTTNNYYDVNTDGESVVVYIRAVNVMGPAVAQKIEVIDSNSIRIIGEKKIKVGNESVYDVLDMLDAGVKSSCTFELKDTPANVTIDANGKLSVDKDCKLDEVTIVVKGKAGTAFEGKQSEFTVSIIRDEETTKEKTTKPTEKETLNLAEKETTLVTEEETKEQKETTAQEVESESAEETTKGDEMQSDEYESEENADVDDKVDGMTETGDDVSEKVIILTMLALLAAIATILVSRKNKYE